MERQRAIFRGLARGVFRLDAMMGGFRAASAKGWIIVASSSTSRRESTNRYLHFQFGEMRAVTIQAEPPAPFEASWQGESIAGSVDEPGPTHLQCPEVGYFHQRTGREV